MPPRILATILVISACLTAVGGCAGADAARYNTTERQQQGLVLLLPGIEGEGPFSYAVRQGLDEAGVDQALSIYRWGWPIPGAMLLNQIDFRRARRVAKKVADRVVKYRDKHPGRPVHLLGHSGGGAIAVFAAEALPPPYQVDGIILLSPSLSSGYDLSEVLAKSQKGIVHFWSPGDIALLVVGTSLFGNLDGVHGPAAGATGFTKTEGNVDLFGKLYELQWGQDMAGSGHLGGHMGTTHNRFVNQWIAAWVLAECWPVARGAKQTAPADSATSQPAAQTEGGPQ